MKTLKPLLWTVVLFASIWACQKEKSFERGTSAAVSDGSLQGAGGACLGSTVGGIYKKDTTLTSGNFVDVSVLVNVPGTYTIGTDTINGIYFRATGTFTAAGTATVRLPGTGKPIAVGTNVFTVTYDSTSCTFPVTTVSGTGGGTGSAVFSLDGNPNACAGVSVQGVYKVNVACNSTNTVTLHVTVTTPGLYTLSASTPTVNGIVFQGSGTLAAGAQTIVLTAQGTPTAAGSFTVPVTAGSTTCSFPLTIAAASGGAAVFTLSGAPNACQSFTTQGTYTAGVQLTAANTVTAQVNVTTVGTYSISTTSADGITFSGTGTFAATGPQPVILTGSGTPTAGGSFGFTVNPSGSSCTFNLNINDIDYFPRTTNSNWSYEYDDDNTDSVLDKATAIPFSALGNTYTVFMEDDGTSVDTLGYYRKAGHDYFQYMDIGFLYGLDQEVWGEYIFLTDNVNNGTAWNSPVFSGTVNGLPVQVRLQMSIVNRDATVTFTTSTGPQSFPNTTSVRQDFAYFDGTTWQVIPDVYIISYYSRNIGLVKAELYDASNTVQSQEEVRRYQVF